MKCPTCVASGTKSKVYIEETRTTTMAGSSYYDEEGVYQQYNPNMVTTEYRCNLGHIWAEDTKDVRTEQRQFLVEPAPIASSIRGPRSPSDPWNTLMSTTADGKPLGEGEE